MPARPTYAFDVEGHTVVVQKKKSVAGEYPGLARCTGCGATLIAPADGKPYWCIECSQKQDGTY